MSLKYSIVIFDLDGVLADTSSSWGFVHEHFNVSNEANVKAYFDSEIDDLEFMRRDIAIWKSCRSGLTQNDVSAILATVPLMPQMVPTLRTLHESGLSLAIISGGLKLLADRISEFVKIDFIFANGLGTDGIGRLNGEGILNVPLMHKEQVMLKLLNKLSIPESAAVAVGDSRVDVGMLERAGLGIAFCPMDETVIDSADVVITRKDLSEILKYII